MRLLEVTDVLCSCLPDGTSALRVATSVQHAAAARPVFCCLQEAACGCAGIFSAPIALALYAEAFDSVGALDRLEGFASRHGPAFYGLPPNTLQVHLVSEEWQVPEMFPFGQEAVVPMRAGQTVKWRVRLDVEELQERRQKLLT